MITRDEVLMGRDKAYPLTAEMELNLETLLYRLNKVRRHYGKPMIVSSGYRPGAINSTVPGASKKSAHMNCMACDFEDPDGRLAVWCLKNRAFLRELGLCLEDPNYTKGWVHLDIKPRKNTVFIP